MQMKRVPVIRDEIWRAVPPFLVRIDIRNRLIGTEATLVQYFDDFISATLHKTLNFVVFPSLLRP